MNDTAEKLAAMVEAAEMGHEEPYHDEHGYEFHDEGSPYCPECDKALAAFAELESLATALAQTVLAQHKALERITTAPSIGAVISACEEARAALSLTDLANAMEETNDAV